jgi:hypothetical protein
MVESGKDQKKANKLEKALKKAQKNKQKTVFLIFNTV